MRVESGRSTISSTSNSSSRIATRVSSPVVLIRISRFTRQFPSRSSPHVPCRLGSGRAAVQLPQERSRDHQPLNLTGSFSDLADLRVPHHPLDRVLLHVAVPAVDLHRLR